MNRANDAARADGACEDEVRLVDLLAVLADRWRLLLAAPLLAGAATLGVTNFVRPVYTAGTTLLVPQQQAGAAAALAQQLGALAGLAGAAGVVRNPADQFVALIHSRTVATRLVERFSLVERYGVETPGEARHRLGRRTDVRAGKDGLISIEVDDDDPRMAARIADGYVEELARLTGELAIGEAAQRRAFFEGQLVGTRARLDAAASALRAAGVGEGALKAEPRVAIEAVARLRAAVTGAELRLAGLRHAMSDRHPEVRQALAELAALREQLARAEASDTRGAKDAEDYVARFRDFKYQETLFELLARQLEMARLDEAREGAPVQVVDPAEVPERRSWPKRTLMSVVAAIGTFVLALGAAFVLEGLGGRFADPRSVERLAQLRERFGRRRPADR